MENASKPSGGSMEKATIVADPPCKSVACEGIENVSVGASANESATPSCSTIFFSALSAPLSNEKKAAIERSKVHWSELMACDHDDHEVAEVSNMKVFELLQSHPSFGHFFRTFGDGGVHDCDELEVGEKLAEGGQAEIYHASITWKHPWQHPWPGQVAFDNENGVKYVLKVFWKGTFLRQLQNQWPERMFRENENIVERTISGKPQHVRLSSEVISGTLLEDAFLMVSETEDLRVFIDHRMKGRLSVDCGPFSMERATAFMYVIAQGVEHLHNLDIIHRDLKASNVLCAHSSNESDPNSRTKSYARLGKGSCVIYSLFIADYECSIGVVGSGFFRAPEILQALKDKVVDSTPNLFTKASDVYSYGMVCYEILTGRLPFEGHCPKDYDLVLKGQRPKVPYYVADWGCDLLFRCWQANPEERPSCREILNLLEANSARCRECRRIYEEKENR